MTVTVTAGIVEEIVRRAIPRAARRDFATAAGDHGHIWKQHKRTHSQMNAGLEHR